MEEPLKLSLDEGIARLILHRPKFFNAFDLEMVRLMEERLVELSGDPLVIGVVISGEGKSFCAGGDMKSVYDSGKGAGETLHALAAKYHQSILEIRRMPKPVIAAINGIAAGGGFSLALACDFRIMEASAVFRQAYTTNGLSIDGGGTFTLPRLVGMARAMEIAAFDHPVSAQQALSWGLVTEMVKDGQAMERAVEMVKEIQKVPLSSFAASKKLITDSFDTSFETQIEKERELLSLCADHPNGREGIAAFLEKREPVYT